MSPSDRERAGAFGVVIEGAVAVRVFTIATRFLE
jgi:hypothetical protein